MRTNGGERGPRQGVASSKTHSRGSTMTTCSGLHCTATQARPQAHTGVSSVAQSPGQRAVRLPAVSAMGVTGLAALAAVGFRAARTVLRTSWFIMMTQRGEAVVATTTAKQHEHRRHVNTCTRQLQARLEHQRQSSRGGGIHTLPSTTHATRLTNEMSMQRHSQRPAAREPTKVLMHDACAIPPPNCTEF